MAKNGQVQNVAIVGTGVIGASWAALYLARGFNVVATDPAPNAEANLRKYIDAAWKDLTAIGLSPDASRERLKFTLDMQKALSDADLFEGVFAGMSPLLIPPAPPPRWNCRLSVADADDAVSWGQDSVGGSWVLERPARSGTGPL